jgi:hypothetical protein
MAATTKRQTETLRLLVLTLREAIQSSGKNGIPSGELYAMCMGHMSLNLYQSVIAGMTDAGLITNKGFLLKMKG